MKPIQKILGMLAVMVMVAGCAELDQLAKNVQGSMPQTNSLGKIIAGLKEALSIGTGNAVVDVSHVGGYFKNQAIKILLPPEIQKTTNALRKFGFGKVVDDFERSMNSAAEQAAPQAKAIFLDAIRNMSFADARRILNGYDSAATHYLRKTTSQSARAPSQTASRISARTTRPRALCASIASGSPRMARPTARATDSSGGRSNQTAAFSISSAAPCSSCSACCRSSISSLRAIFVSANFSVRSSSKASRSISALHLAVSPAANC